ncbi:hypothetical protein BHK23_002812 [Escherichia coli]|nr:hypothetical protein [Escherichia coli]
MTIPKPNGDVLRKIEQVKDDCSREFSQRNFASAYYIDEQTKEFLAELEKNHESVVFTERGAQASFFLHYGSTSKQLKPESGEITLAATER